jgi:hypothetical protein
VDRDLDDSAMKVYVKVMRMGSQLLVAACDAGLLGKTLRFGKIVFEVRQDFYGGSLVTVREAMEIIRDAPNINLIGSLIVDEALKEGLVHPQAILDISGVPHTQIIRL